MASSFSSLNAHRHDAGCACDADKLAAVHAYLSEHFPDCELRHFHSPTRLLQAGYPPPPGEHHVVSLLREDALPYYVVLLSEFLERSADAVPASIEKWDLAAAGRAYRIVIVSKEGIAPL